MTTWACVSPQITIAATTTLYVLIFVCYYLMDKKCLESLSPPADCKHSGVEYTALETKGKVFCSGYNESKNKVSPLENGFL